MIFLVALDVPIGGRFDFLQLADIDAGNLRRGQGLIGRFLIGGSGLVHGLLHIAGGFRQLFHRGDTSIRSSSQCGHYPHDTRHSRRNAHDDVDTRDRRRQEGRRRSCYLRRHGVPGQSQGYTADYNTGGGNPLDNAWVILDEFINAGKNVCSDFVQTAHLRNELLPNGSFQCVPRGLHQGQLAVHVVQLDICHALGRAGAVVDTVGEGSIVRVGGIQNGQ